jgi:type II secretory pathway component PulC
MSTRNPPQAAPAEKRESNQRHVKEVRQAKVRGVKWRQPASSGSAAPRRTFVRAAAFRSSLIPLSVQ